MSNSFLQNITIPGTPLQPDKHDFPYWMVWHRHSGRPPRFRHASLGAATAEAERLAAKYPGRRFYVLCVLSSTKIETPAQEVA